jgi:hypothetical protein
MANGNGPVPSMPSTIWSVIKNATWSASGLSVAGTIFYLTIVQDEPPSGKAKWAIYDTANMPADCFKALLPQAHWALISGGELSEANNWITKSSANYRISFVRNGSDANAYVKAYP